MSKSSTQSLSRQKIAPAKMALGLIVAAVSVIIGTASFASATSGGAGYGGGGIHIDIGNIIGDGNIIIIIINYIMG